MNEIMPLITMIFILACFFPDILVLIVALILMPFALLADFIIELVRTIRGEPKE